VTRRALVAAALAVGLSASPAFGQSSKSYDVFGDEGSEPKAEEAEASSRVLVFVIPTSTLALEIGAAASSALADARKIEAVDPRGGLLPQVEAKRRRGVEAAVKASKAGLEALDRLELEGASSTLEQAVDVLGAELDLLGPPEREALDEALFGLAAMAMSNGQQRQAEAGFVALAFLSPNYQPDPERFPPNVVHRFEAVRMMREHRQTGSAIVETAPPGARVEVDGTPRGTTPLTVELADGLHLIAVARLGYGSAATLTPVRAQKTSRAIFDLEATPALEAVEGLSQGPELAQALERARTLHVSHLALLTMSPGDEPSIAGPWIDVRAAKTTADVRSVLPRDSHEAGARIAALIEAAEQARLRAPAAKVEASEEPLVERWWFWAAAVVAGAAVAGIAVAASHEGPRPPLNSHILGF
jgi:hypothetical protein